MSPLPHDPLLLPDAEAWASIGLVCGEELHGGHQSRVFAATSNGQPVVVKLTDGRFIDETHQKRLEVVSKLAAMDHRVVGPLPFPWGLSAEQRGWLIAKYPVAAGRRPNTRDENDVRTMATVLAGLHRSLAELDPLDLPLVAPLDGIELPAELCGPSQLLHGDFSDTNMLLDGAVARVFDFDGCCCGPVEYEVGDTLYMALFDATISADLDRYERFRTWFVGEYRTASKLPVTEAALDAAIDLRVAALERWLARPETAPIGIRAASPEWHEVLRSFISSTRAR